MVYFGCSHPTYSIIIIILNIRDLRKEFLKISNFSIMVQASASLVSHRSQIGKDQWNNTPSLPSLPWLHGPIFSRTWGSDGMLTVISQFCCNYHGGKSFNKIYIFYSTSNKHIYYCMFIVWYNFNCWYVYQIIYCMYIQMANLNCSHVISWVWDVRDGLYLA